MGDCARLDSSVAIVPNNCLIGTLLISIYSHLLIVLEVFWYICRYILIITWPFWLVKKFT